ncbi:sensor domain-containing diguanylate cyclase [Alkalihalobacillus sp. MEB130]|uniref:sensor domain-containing diguanylate cyclase n=1 Tax=Alkalihalobacillus sp. MEB130 TaxID=2976704 RepID=UPI0028E09927|nr:sensor domain-containing diguanylate cyclase [Alkalihalobacillus sp. MEB130]MDT8859375.1 sensor domain-containing diguanylate cyclase [Alkalihalobacillus sp. MEB130]
MKNDFKVQPINNRYDIFLDKVVSRMLAHQTFFKPAVFFVASEDRILSLQEVGYLPKELVKATSYFCHSFQVNKMMMKYGDCHQISVPIFQEEKKLFLGVIIQCTNEKSQKIHQYLEIVSIGLVSANLDQLFEPLGVSPEELLIAADYRMEFSRLAKALVTCYTKKVNRHIGIYELNHKKATLVCSSTKLPMDEVTITELFIDEQLEQTDMPFLVTGEKLNNKNTNAYLLFPVVFMSNVVSFLVFSFESDEEVYAEKEHYCGWVNKLIPIFEKGLEQPTGKVEKRKDILLQVTKKFHSTMDIANVLDEIVAAIKNVYPRFHVHLLISQEWKVNHDLPIKPFMYGTDSSNRMAEQAYLTGRIQVDHEAMNENIVLYAPLKGKQGVYGVMEIELVDYTRIPRAEIEFIKMLADTGGIALENAELFQQSRKLIYDLQLINETSHQLNLNLRLSDTINFMTRQITESFGAEQVGFIIFQPNGGYIVLEGSSPLFSEAAILDELEPFLQRMKREKDSVFIGDTDIQNEKVIEGYKSILSVPMIQNKELKGVVIAIHHKTNHFSFDNFKLLQSLVFHSTLAFTNSMLHEELERLVITDHLTRLHSRRFLDECIQESLQKDANGSFLLLDIDDFKTINDTFGHQVGDDIIIQVANVLKKNIREGDIAARWGGEELAIYFPRVEIKIGKQIAHRILRAVELETSPRVTVSIGLSSWSSSEKGMTLQKLFKLADQGLYDAKEAGKNRVIVK